MLTRRDALKALSAIGLVSALPPLAAACGKKDPVPPPSDPVFGYGVASGDPLATSVILWTKVITTEPVDGNWEVATDATFANIVAHGTFTATDARNYTVKIDATGLTAGTTYFYRFIALGRTSAIGRTRTAPTDPSQLRFALVSCANVPYGYFHVYAALAERSDIDAIVHLGDYIYEYADGDYGKVRTSEPSHALQTLDDYRTRYAQYRRDPDLQEAHRQHPFICIWDDHEFLDNAYRDGATGDNNKALGSWPDHRTAAATAYSEWIPIRDQPAGKIWRKFQYGALVDMFLLDTRIWGRDIQVPKGDPALADPARQILGADQEAWLADGLTSSTARWKLVCQQVMMTNVPSWFRDDGWDDYPAARSRFYDILEKSKVDDVVVLSGDVHSSWASDLTRAPDAPSLAVELIAPAISSPGNQSMSAPALVADAPWLKYVDLTKRGFILLTVTEEKAQGAWYYVEDVEKEDGGATTFGAAYATYSGQNRIQQETSEPT